MCLGRGKSGRSRAGWIPPLPALLLVLAVSATGNSPSPPAVVVADFSRQEPGQAPAGWMIRHLGGSQTRYQLIASERGTVLQAASIDSAEALVRKLRLAPARYPILEWSWKIDQVVAGAGWTRKRKDDFPARLFVIFKRRRGLLSGIGGLMARISGSLPGEALNYVWKNGPEVSRPVRSPYTRRVVMVPVEQGASRVGQWRTERRNILEDFRQAFGREPGPVIGIALMSDTDNTGSAVTACYGDIRLLSPALQLQKIKPRTP